MGAGGRYTTNTIRVPRPSGPGVARAQADGHLPVAWPVEIRHTVASREAAIRFVGSVVVPAAR
jgi:hypothetical protein